MLAGTFLCFGYLWVFRVWDELDVNEVIYQLNAPLQGTGNGMIRQFVLTAVVPSVLATLAVIGLTICLQKAVQTEQGRPLMPYYRALRIAAPAAGLIMAAGAVWGFWTRLDVSSYLKELGNRTSYIEDNYADPAKTTITFPEKKRNLIFIYMESMESTFADKANGGAFDENIIPELTQIAIENEDFSGSEQTLNSGKVMPANHYTMGAIFGISSGLPLKVNVSGLSAKFIADNKIFDGNDMSMQEHFFDNTVMIGDILEGQGYHQIFMIGSDATFGGRRLFFEKHGNYEIYDYPYAIEKGWIEPDYKVFWGYEDEKLFSFAQNLLPELYEQEEPFNLTLLTVDTHFEDGYVCRLCDDRFGDNQYANVMACSSRQTAAFIEWCMQQDFFKDTTIVVTGDHTTMDKDFCKDVPEDYSRGTYTVFINAAAQPADPSRRRQFSTQDIFPTTVAALGAQIEGDRLGLGTNLFSDRDTIVEEIGLAQARQEQLARSEFMDKMADIDLYSSVYEEKGAPSAWLAVKDVQEDGTATLLVHKIRRLYVGVEKMEVEIYPREDGGDQPGKDPLMTVQVYKTEDGNYEGTADLSGLDLTKLSARVKATAKTGQVYVLREIKKLSGVTQ